mgnify:CR=1 FL=1
MINLLMKRALTEILIILEESHNCKSFDGLLDNLKPLLSKTTGIKRNYIWNQIKKNLNCRSG